MDKSELFENIRINLKDKLHFLEDKPEENLESTIKALWLTAAGFKVSAEIASGLDLPELTEMQVNDLNKLIDFRLNNIPLAHITKRQNFMGIDFISDKRALIPRKETELLGKKALEISFKISDSKETINVMDICCGCGNLGIAISHFNQKCKVYAADISIEAIELAKENVNFLNQNKRVKVKTSDLFSGFESDEFYENINLIVCNPPYISTAKVSKMNAEISLNEPVLAFDGGMLGLKIIQKLVNEAPRFLTPEGWLVFEVGAGQGDFIMKLIEKTMKYQQSDSVIDEDGNIRVVLTQKSIVSN
jgi:release factor glutamine methyltransferase